MATTVSHLSPISTVHNGDSDGHSRDLVEVGSPSEAGDTVNKCDAAGDKEALPRFKAKPSKFPVHVNVKRNLYGKQKPILENVTTASDTLTHIEPSRYRGTGSMSLNSSRSSPTVHRQLFISRHNSGLSSTTSVDEDGRRIFAFDSRTLSDSPTLPSTGVTTPASKQDLELLSTIDITDQLHLHFPESELEHATSSFTDDQSVDPSPPEPHEVRKSRSSEVSTTQEIVIPHPIIPTFPERPVTPTTPDSSVTPASSVAVAEPDVAPSAEIPPDADQLPPRSRWWQFGGKKIATIDKPVVASAVAIPALILPTPPTDREKFLFGQTRRVPLYVFGTLSFLSVSVGMWFFTDSAVYFYWFGILVGLIQIYLIISYAVGYLGRDFDLKAHEKLLEEFPITEEPLVDIYLPCCKEPLEVLENTYKHVSKLDYTNFKVYVLDDGGLNTVKQLAEHYGFNYITRDDKPRLKKAGNLRWAFARTSGDFFIIYDADFCPRTDFLRTTLPYMKKYEDLAILQTPQFFRPISEQTWVEQGASATQELFYRVVQVNRDRWGASICVGSNAVYRRGALLEVGGTAEIGHSEDVHTGFYAVNRGWKLKYIPLALACGVSPDTPKAFFSQQMRWCSGSTTLLTNPEFWTSKLNFVQRICYLSGMMYYSGAALMIFLSPLPGLLMLCICPSRVMWYNTTYAIPSLLYSVIIFRLWSRSRYNFNVNFVFVIQQYAYLMAIKDRIFGTTASWVPSGDNNSHGAKTKEAEAGIEKKKSGGNNKYRNMRILCCMWVGFATAIMIAGTTLRIVQGYPWYNFLPLILLDLFNLFISHKFMFYSR